LHVHREGLDGPIGIFDLDTEVVLTESVGIEATRRRRHDPRNRDGKESKEQVFRVLCERCCRSWRSQDDRTAWRPLPHRWECQCPPVCFGERTEGVVERSGRSPAARAQRQCQDERSELHCAARLRASKTGSHARTDLHGTPPLVTSARHRQRERARLLRPIRAARSLPRQKNLQLACRSKALRKWPNLLEWTWAAHDTLGKEFRTYRKHFRCYPWKSAEGRPAPLVQISSPVPAVEPSPIRRTSRRATRRELRSYRAFSGADACPAGLPVKILCHKRRWGPTIHPRHLPRRVVRWSGRSASAERVAGASGPRARAVGEGKGFHLL